MTNAFNPIYSSVGAPGGVISADKLVTSAQLLAMFATPVVIVPAPGAGLALVFDSITVHKPAGTAYGGIAAGEDLTVKYTDQSGLEVAEIETTGFLDQATAQTRVAGGFRAASGIASVTPVVNAALVLALLVGEIITGDSPLHVRTAYRVVPASAFAS